MIVGGVVNNSRHTPQRVFPINFSVNYNVEAPDISDAINTMGIDTGDGL